MRPACRIGLVGRAAARATARRRARLCAPAAGRHEAAVPPLAARLLERHDRSRRAPGERFTHTELRLAPVTVLVSAERSAPAAAVVALPLAARSAPAAPAPERAAGRVEMRLLRETLRERVERTVERLAARGRRDEPSQRATAPAPVLAPARGAPPALPEPVFPKLALAAVADGPRAAALAASAAAPGAGAARAPAAAPSPTATPIAAQVPELPRLVDAVVGELERRIHAERERKGWLS